MILSILLSLAAMYAALCVAGCLYGGVESWFQQYPESAYERLIVGALIVGLALQIVLDVVGVVAILAP